MISPAYKSLLFCLGNIFLAKAASVIADTETEKFFRLLPEGAHLDVYIQVSVSCRRVLYGVFHKGLHQKLRHQNLRRIRIHGDGDRNMIYRTRIDDVQIIPHMLQFLLKGSFFSAVIGQIAEVARKG